MQPEDFRPEDLFAQIQGLVDALQTEREARLKAETSDRAKSDLLATVSHELRTPLSAVLSMSELLLASPLDARQRRYAETLQHSARGLLTVLNDILDYTRLEAGRFELQDAPFDLHDLVQSVAAVLQTRASEKGLASGLDIGASCPRTVAGDSARLRQVLTNLIDNALKFTPEGSVRLHVSAQEAFGQLVLRFDVADTGIGLGRKEQARIFQPYVQVGRASAAQHAGTGLGLSIAKQLVELMGGTIGCESVPSQGSVFWFTMPVEQVEPEAQAVPQASAARKLRGHVLVVEDNSVNRMLIGAYLDEFGLSHDMVTSGADAVMALASQSYDLVLMDVMMPELDGIETTKRIRQLKGPSADVPVVALTANALKGDREKYLAAGMSAYVSKPIRGRELYQALAPFLAAGDDLAAAS